MGTLMNRIGNCANIYQRMEFFKPVLCVCSAGLLRSPTAAVVLSQPPFNFNTRCAGVTTEFALVPVDEALLVWAEEIVCMELKHEQQLKEIMAKSNFKEKPIIRLDIPDEYPYRNPDLMELIKNRYIEKTGFKSEG